MNEADFFKFPSTPHIIFSSPLLSRIDKILPLSDRALLLDNYVTIEEKIDGANLGISFDNEGNMLLQNRGHIIAKPYQGQWSSLDNWINVYQDALFDALGDKLIIFGEWCYAKHSIHYHNLPGLFIAFDVFDKEHKRFYSVLRRNQLVDRLNIPVVPLIKYGKFQLEDIPSLLRESAYGNTPCEGLYIRYDVGDWLEIRAKYVRSDFIQTIEKHWQRQPLVKNHVHFY